MAAGIRAVNPRARVQIVDEAYYQGPGDAHVLVFYGLQGRLPTAFLDFALDPSRRAIYVDLGYFGRRSGGRWRGYHKVAINSRHPTSYYRTPQHPGDRFAEFGLKPQPMTRAGRHVVLAGMSDKGARAEGFEPEEWERWAINEIRKTSERAIIYRPKPSWQGAKPIEGTLFSGRDRTIERDLVGAWALVTHHSNAAVDAALAGVPAWCWQGVGRDMASQKIGELEAPLYPSEALRLAWFHDIAYTQWGVDEMFRGLPWDHFRREGLL